MDQFQYQKDRRFFAQLAQGFEAPAIKELHELGATQIEPAFRGIYFSADPEKFYAINYQSRLLSRILAPLVSFRCKDRDDLYRATRLLNWPSVFSLESTFGIFSNVTGNRNLTHSKFAALCMKDAVVDTFRDRFGRRPYVDSKSPDLWLNLYIEKDSATISLDTSGGPMHRRGYRRQTVTAPMQETLAAAIVAESGWQGEQPLYDPMCGSGTLLCEAAMHFCRIPSGYLRKTNGVQCLPDFDRTLWRAVKSEADAKIRGLPPGMISGSDKDPAAVRAARANCGLLPGGKEITLNKTELNFLDSLENRMILCNPPYGVRMRENFDLSMFYKQLGDFLKQRCKGSTAYIYFGNRDMLKHIGLRPAWKKPMRNAGLDGRLAKFELY